MHVKCLASTVLCSSLKKKKKRKTLYIYRKGKDHVQTSMTMTEFHSR